MCSHVVIGLVDSARCPEGLRAQVGRRFARVYSPLSNWDRRGAAASTQALSAGRAGVWRHQVTAGSEKDMSTDAARAAVPQVEVVCRGNLSPLHTAEHSPQCMLGVCRTSATNVSAQVDTPAQSVAFALSP